MTSPNNGAAVPREPFIKGIAPASTVSVWVVVRPLPRYETARAIAGVGGRDHWVQPQATIHRDLTWTAKVYIGRPGDVDVGIRFKITAVGDPRDPLREGDVLQQLPKAKWRSDTIGVVRI